MTTKATKDATRLGAIDERLRALDITHHFRVCPAVFHECGFNAALLHEWIAFRCADNDAQRKNGSDSQLLQDCFIDGHQYVFHSIAKLQSTYFPFFSKKEVKTGIDKLLAAGYIKKTFSQDVANNTALYRCVSPSER